MALINPYLNFPGNTEEAFNFYKSVFGGEFAMLQRFKDTPDGANIPTDAKEKIMHIALPISKGNVIMGTDALESMGHPLTIGNNFSLSITTESEAEADKLFNSLSAGGVVTLPMAKMPWNSYFGMCTDKYKIQWMISFEYK